MTTPRTATVALCAAAVVLAAAWTSDAWTQNCTPGTGVPGTLAAPSSPCAGPAKPKPEPGRKKPKEPDSFWSGVHIGGSVGTTTTVRGR